MPTGYTADVEDGKVTELRDFAFRCARAFGALIMMRDDPLDAEIPDTFPVAEYYAKRAMELADQIGALEALTPVQCVSAQNAEIAKARTWRDEYLEERSAKSARYLAMRAKAEAWSPPETHARLKAFMLEQIEASLPYSDYEPPVPTVKDPRQWRDEKVAELVLDLAAARERLDGQRKQAEESAEWVRRLKESL